MSSDMISQKQGYKYHPGTCEATEWGKRYGKNSTPKLYDDHEHQWEKSSDKNWGPWSCCGDKASSNGCHIRAKLPAPVPTNPVEGEKYLKFLAHGTIICRVIGDEGKCWRLDNGRIAKKKTEGTAWIWTEKPL
jgi:hypothetical protein